jgi:hypothetical protein
VEEFPPPPPASLKQSSIARPPNNNNNNNHNNNHSTTHQQPTAAAAAQQRSSSSNNHAGAAIPDAIYCDRFLPVEQNTVRSFMGGGASASSGKYVGQLLRGTVRHGRGSCAMSDGSYYEGDW